MDKIKGRIEITIICMIIGIMLITQIKSIQNLGGLVNTQRAEQLFIELNDVNKENDKLQERINELEENLNNYEVQAGEDNTYVEKLLKEVNELKDLAGFTDLVGPGVIITLDDKPDDDYNAFQWDSSSLLLLVNELNAAGADAISINGERIVNSTSIRYAGNNITINGKKTTYPYVFKVIGDIQTLKSSVLLRGGIRDQLVIYNDIIFEMQETEEITIDKYNGIMSLRYAKPIIKE